MSLVFTNHCKAAVRCLNHS